MHEKKAEIENATKKTVVGEEEKMAQAPTGGDTIA